ncbi:MAG TPA: alpha-L-rhamnosidase [Opitutaceae bacterium]|jgi:hypothetical protein
MNRRRFLKQFGAATLALAHRKAWAAAEPPSRPPAFCTANARWQSAYDAALAVLAGNVRHLPQCPDDPVLIEGAQYNGIWMECGPHESLVYRKFRPDAARGCHRIFFNAQHPDGQFPASIRTTGAGYGQIQMVVPLASTAWELARATGDESLLHAAYAACSRWDNWLVRYRNHRGTGLVEGVCTYDAGTDNSPRWAGMPNRCPDGDARQYPSDPTLPRLCPDLSATSYGARVALSQMAKALGRDSESDQWAEKAGTLRRAILSQLYSPEDAAFYDRDAQGRFVRVRSEIITRVCSEHVPDQKLFDELWRRQIHLPTAFWPDFPIPSVALDDPHFVRPIPHNSWGGASQALTALRTSRWFDHYGRPSEHGHLMSRWCEAIQRDPTFRQQIDPLSGVFTDGDNPAYSPCALVMYDFTWRLAGIVEHSTSIDWNVHPEHPVAQSARFALTTDGGSEAALSYGPQGVSLQLAGREIAVVKIGAARVTTDNSGRIRQLTGISQTAERVVVKQHNREPMHFLLNPNQVVAFEK